MHSLREVGSDVVRTHTRPRKPPLVPEVSVRVADDVVALWEALEEHGVAPEEPPFWAAAWPGGQALARYVLDHAEVVRGRAVLDLGSGSGLVAVAARLAGAGEVTASEVDPLGRLAVAANVEGNGVSGIRVVGDLLDGEPPTDAVVLAGDVCYDRAMTERVVPFLEGARSRGSAVLVGDPGRPYLPRDRLIELAAYDVPDADGGGPRRTIVWRWR